MHITIKCKKLSLGHAVKDAYLQGIRIVKKVWRLYDIEIGDVFASRDVIFHKETYLFATKELLENGELSKLEQHLGWFSDENLGDFRPGHNPDVR